MGPEQGSDGTGSWGYLTGFADRYKVAGQVGKGGNGIVNKVVQKATGREYACKVLPKQLADARASEQKKAAHPESVRHEVEALLLLRGTLNVAGLEAAYEDDRSVYIVMELCRGGDIIKAMKSNPSNESMLASIIRAVLQVVAHCHAVKFLHRDIKPENFLLSEAGEKGHLKAIDFGLALPFDPANLPLSVSVLEGTPWYLAPEACRGKFEPATDVWAVGAMTAQLLTGELPFNDPVSPKMPSMQRARRSIIRDEVDYGKKGWSRVSPLAREFVASLLRKEPASRPSAAQALKHPWIQEEEAAEQVGVRKIDKSVVQRLQRFANASYFKRSVLEHIAADMLTLRARDQQPLDARLGSFLRLPPSSAAADNERRLGYDLDPDEVDALMRQLDIAGTGRLQSAEVAASIIDWHALQECARRAFEQIDTDGSGYIEREELVAYLSNKLSPYEVCPLFCNIHYPAAWLPLCLLRHMPSCGPA
ncbi:kinase-like protein [Coccomyxa subellipsoidea C-169]|uniref:Kinase-like protein n=1 Tax=Coccomyxa subellipsoidea (strain C-169) TaxID=574566 RepID=I0ZAI0_COCSC|nr:kinase-like protein [Coccomyxa subellipsoidea C-169]EIE27649.1 kinase-like protein [Coccomyxa subellipsoidea C-169]|eukprot:XP_005652193.1 kinase-like protein [Coccomyxa subellipsoidea C-169]